jgi:hypothetical protein
MSASLELRFETGGRPGVTRVHGRVFRLYAIDGKYGLPMLVLETADGVPRVTLQETAVVEVRNAIGASDLSTWLRDDWNGGPRPAIVITARHQLLADAALPVAVIRRDLSRQPAGELLHAEVIWKVSYEDATVLRTILASVVLEFAPEGEPVPPPTPDDDAAEDPRLRDVSGRPVHAGFAAVDFGTSASTVTVYDSRKMTAMAIDYDQADCLREGILALIKDNPPTEDPATASAWRRLLEQVVANVLQKAPATVDLAGVRTIDDLGNRLSVSSAAEQGLLDLVCLALENAQAGMPPKLQEWLAPRLHDCYDRAFQVPPLSQLNLKRVPFGTGAEPFQTPSSVRRVGDQTFELVFCDQAAADYPDLKRSLGKAAPVPGLSDGTRKPPTTDDLIARIYLRLVARAEEFAEFPEEPPETLPPLEEIPALNELIVTYPTTTPPNTRDQLAQLVRTALDAREVVAVYDEGVAAGLFFVARDFAGNRSVGLEALRARSRRAPGSDPEAWEQNIMVIDIGGGTTDIALLRLTLTDLTPDMPADVKPHVPGRYYLLRPEVLGSTGHPQLGGDYLTLKVFYWLKATIVDALLDHPAATPGWISLKNLVPRSLYGTGDAVNSLAKSVLRYGVKQEGLAARDVAEALRKIIPTHSASGEDKPRLTEPFKQMWYWAEQAKRQLGAGGDFVLYQDVLKDALSGVVPVEKPDILGGLMPADGIRLDPADFETLAYPVFEKMVRLAKPVLFQKSWDHRLDRVMLSGRGSAMPALRAAVVAELAAIRAPADGADAVTGTDRSLSWNPAAITVEQRLAKQVTSIGACWAHSVSAFKLAAPEDAIPHLLQARTEIAISVENLFINLPCDFKVKGLGVDLDPLLMAGTPFQELDESGTLGVRSAWRAMPRRFEIHRPIDEDDGESIQWGRFVLEDDAAAEDFRPELVTWFGDTERGIRARVMASVEMGHDLAPSINLCNGPPHFVVSGQALDLLSELPADCVGHDDHGDAQLIKLPWDVVAVGETGRGGAEDKKKTIFAAWDGGQAGAGLFTEAFHDQLSMEAPYVMGSIAELPPAPNEGINPEYTFYVVDGGGPRLLGTLPLPGAWSPRAVYRATLDRKGRLRIHRGLLPYWPAQSLRDVQDRAGAVRRIQLECDVPFSNPAWEPFSGRH